MWISDQVACSNTFREGNYAVEALVRLANHLVNAQWWFIVVPLLGLFLL